MNRLLCYKQKKRIKQKSQRQKTKTNAKTKMAGTSGLSRDLNIYKDISVLF